jgi:hypothetical protein
VFESHLTLFLHMESIALKTTDLGGKEFIVL